MLVLSDDFADQDLIGHADYCDGLVEMIRSVESRGSFTIGIYGQWGSGKTSMLKQIKKALDDQDAKEPILTVWFNPWQYVSEEHLIIPFFHTLIASLEQTVNELKPEQRAKNVSVFLKKLAHVPLALAYGLEAELKIPFLLRTKFSFAKAMDYGQKADNEIEGESSKKNETSIKAAAPDYESIYYNLLQLLQDAATELDVKIVIFIDDLDRCLPEKAVQLLEGLKVLLDLKNFIFVMGVAQEVIERGIRVRYRELYLAGQPDDLPNIEGQYLDKIIQFPFSLPAPNPAHLKKNILFKQLSHMKGTAQFVEIIYEALGSNPRAIKRFINAISFSLHLAKIKSREKDDFHPGLLVKICLIGYLFPALYRQLEKYPSHLVRLEEIVGKIEKESKELGEGLIEGQGPHVENVGLPIIDQWLEDDKIGRLLPILRIRPMGQEDNAAAELSFNTPETVIKYVRLLSTSFPPLKPIISHLPRESGTLNIPLLEQMRDRMVKIPAGKFIMGDDRSGRVDVTLRPYMIDKYPVTQALYREVMRAKISHFNGADRPVENLSWFHAVEFCNELSRQIGLEEAYKINGKRVARKTEANGYRLPTEAEWEYACRARAIDEHYENLADICWYRGNSGGETHGVGQKMANDFQLYDMLGNVWEWCNDWYAKYPDGPLSNPSGPESGSARVVRGGGWDDDAWAVRSTARNHAAPRDRVSSLGFRLVLPLDQ